MALNPKPSRIENTKQQYLNRTKNLVVQCRKKLNIPNNESIDYRRFVGWLVTQKKRWNKETWRQYKASVLYFLELEENKGDHIASEAIEYLYPITVDGCSKKTKKTSGIKQKKVSIKEYRSIINNIEEHQTPWASDVLRWIKASMLTGLRPIEWSTSKIENYNGLLTLIVNNAKATNGRAHGITRHIIIEGLTKEEKEIIQYHIKRANEWEQAQQYKKFYHGCASTLANAIKRIWPNRKNHITLYSFRHQFAADAKASGFTREEIAALMGHAVDVTATRHYGRKTAGFNMVRVRPDPIEVARIRSVFKDIIKLPHPDVKLNKNMELKPNEEK